MKPIFTDTTIFNRLIALVVIGLGGASIGLQANWFSEKANYAGYSTVVKSVTGLDTVGNAPDVIIAGAIIVIIAGVLAMVVTFIKSKPARIVYIAALLIAVAGGVVQLAGGLAIQTNSFLNALGPNTYVYNEGRSASEHLAGDQLKMATFGIALFEGCCRSQTVPKPWASMGPFGPCNVTCPSETSGKLIDERVKLFTDGIDTSDLCTCTRDENQGLYNSYLAAMTTDKCNTLKAIKVNFIPGTNIPTTCEKYTCLSLGFIKTALYASTLINKVPLVGYQLDSESSAGTAVKGEGFGCGLGYQKGVMWMQEMYHDQVLRASAASGIGLGVAAIVVVVLAFLLALFLAREDADHDDGRWENTLAAGWNDPATTPPPVAKVVDAPPIAAYQAAANDFSDQLLKFYATHDPLKTQKEVDGIAAWGKQNGLAALNKKLRDKYNADLSGGDGGPPI